ncbi:hypothetical protein PPTG_08246 [Phytophthora nicotianae INRA-310]|uniref:Uncharacterized protein n=1 Tax=Phytophthora nicotianae (strain INRA-310) TaxID=761204 RepID=W2QMD5_PHYN3|nr:hypothetical protein PPTG_08246 [Phytophthora nicotianae INRA-310]ETN13405.1 hypothetical protein PPTG_08246 [Phytophthora nicotianae INRA-310]
MDEWAKKRCRDECSTEAAKSVGQEMYGAYVRVEMPGCKAIESQVRPREALGERRMRTLEVVSIATHDELGLDMELQKQTVSGWSTNHEASKEKRQPTKADLRRQ